MLAGSTPGALVEFQLVFPWRAISIGSIRLAALYAFSIISYPIFLLTGLNRENPYERLYLGFSGVFIWMTVGLSLIAGADYFLMTIAYFLVGVPIQLESFHVLFLWPLLHLCARRAAVDFVKNFDLSQPTERKDNMLGDRG